MKKRSMKKKYIAPVIEEIKLKRQLHLLAGSLFNDGSNDVVLDDSNIIVDPGDIGIDPESREFEMDDDELGDE